MQTQLSTILIMNVWILLVTDGRRHIRRHQNQLPAEWIESRLNLKNLTNSSQFTEAPDIGIPQANGLTTPNATFIQNQVRKNMIRAASGNSAVNLPNFHYNKKEICKTEPLTQIVKEPGCRAASVHGRYCYGQCNSFFIPKNVRRWSTGAVEKSSFKSCSFCRPRAIDWITVRLHCPKDRNKYRAKKIQVVRECSCTALRIK